MKPDCQAKFLFYLVQKQKNPRLVSIEFLLVIVILFVLIMIALPSFLNSNTMPAPLKAKQYVSAMNRWQHIIYMEKRRFSASLTELGFNSTQTDNYVYSIQVHNSTAVTHKGASLKRSLKSYVGGTVVYPIANSSESTTIAVLCESKRPDAHSSSAELPNIKVNAEGKPVCPEGYSDLSQQ